jgi:site-specific DNA recombinase
MIALLYGRESPTDAPGEERVEVQFENTRRWSPTQGWPIGGEFLDVDCSGDVPFDKRAGGQQLLREIERQRLKGQAAVVVVRRPDRLGRGFLLQHAYHLLKLQGALLRVQSEPSLEPETSGGEMLLTVLAGYSGAEKRNINERTRDGQRSRAQAGKFTGGYAPYGYRTNWTLDKRALKAAPEWTEAKVVRQIFAWCLEDALSCPQIAQRLTLLGIPTPSRSGQRRPPRTPGQAVHTHWQTETVRALLTDETYTGTHWWGKTMLVPHPEHRDDPRRRQRVQAPREAWIPQAVPALVNRAQFDRVPAILQRNQLANPRNAKRVYMLGGLVKCRICGSTYFGSYNSCGGTRGFYTCRGRHNPAKVFGPGAAACPGPHVRIEQLDALVWELVRDHLEHEEETVARIREQRAAEEQSASVLEKIRDGIRRTLFQKATERRNTIDLTAQGVFTPAEGTEKLARLRQEEADLTAKLEELDAQAQAAEQQAAALAGIRDYLTAWKARLDQPFSPEEMRDACRQFVDQVWISAEGSETVARVRLKFEPQATGALPISATTLCRRWANWSTLETVRTLVRAA